MATASWITMLLYIGAGVVVLLAALWSLGILWALIWGGLSELALFLNDRFGWDWARRLHEFAFDATDFRLRRNR